MRTGKQYLESLRDGRRVYIGGQVVDDVTAHPAFRRTARSVAALYDLQTQDPDRMTFVSPDAAGIRVGRAWELPKSYAELHSRRRSLTTYAEAHFGFLGRAPDHVASCIAGMRMGVEVFEEYDHARAAALADYYRFARDRDLFLAYVIVSPVDRSPKFEGRPAGTAARIVDRDSHGLTINGTKLIGTGCALADEVFVTTIQRLERDDVACAICFAIPMATRGLKIVSRKSYEWSAGSIGECPLSSRFDENDAILLFENVRVAWDRVFIVDNPEMCRSQFYRTPAHVYMNYQSQIRLAVKLRFLTGLAGMIVVANGIAHIPQVRETLGQLAAEAAMVDSLLDAMEIKGGLQGRYFIPDAHSVYAAQVLARRLYPAAIETLRALSGDSVINIGSGIQDFADSQLASRILGVHSASSFSPEESLQLFRLAWDVIGSEFASRHVQYEMFYAGAEHVTLRRSYDSYDWVATTALSRRAIENLS